MTKKHDELVGQIIDHARNVYEDQEYIGRHEAGREGALAIIALILSAVRDGKVRVKCPECEGPIELFVCNRCHLEGIDGHIV